MFSPIYSNITLANVEGSHSKAQMAVEEGYEVFENYDGLNIKCCDEANNVREAKIPKALEDYVATLINNKLVNVDNNIKGALSYHNPVDEFIIALRKFKNFRLCEGFSTSMDIVFNKMSDTTAMASSDNTGSKTIYHALSCLVLAGSHNVSHTCDECLYLKKNKNEK